MSLIYATKSEPKKKQPAVTLIINQAKGKIFSHITSYPILCPTCYQYSKELHSHYGSHHGNIGSVNCQCGEELKLADSDIMFMIP